MYVTKCNRCNIATINSISISGRLGVSSITPQLPIQVSFTPVNVEIIVVIPETVGYAGTLHFTIGTT